MPPNFRHSSVILRISDWESDAIRRDLFFTCTECLLGVRYTYQNPNIIQGAGGLQKDVIIIGGGLAGTLLALELRTLGFENFLVLESSDRLGGNKTWSCFASDISEYRLPSYMLRARFSSHT